MLYGVRKLSKVRLMIGDLPINFAVLNTIFKCIYKKCKNSKFVIKSE